MSNDPAFLFYTGDFTTGTQFFTDEQVGIYIRLLMAQHQHGHLSDKQVKMICRTHDEDVMLKFEIDSDGKFFNKRLEDVILKRKKYSTSRSENKKGKTKDMIITSKSYDNHMENENENENKDINKDISIEKLESVLLQEVSWQEDVCRVHKIIATTKLPEWINKFVLKIKADDVKGIIISEAKRYFNNWIKIELKNIDKKDIKHTRMTTRLW